MIFRIALASWLAMAVAGCSTFREGRKIDYKSSQTLPSLEVPPDLQNVTSVDRGATTPAGGTTFSTLTSGREAAKPNSTATVLPVFPDMRLERDHNTRWLVVKGDPETLWLRVREFLSAQGLIIARENPRTGIIETDWAENRAKVGTAVQLVLAKWMAALYSTGTRDRFRIRLERGKEPGTTEIYLSHQGMEEVVASGSGSDHISTMWQGRPSDPDLETEMLRLLMAHLGEKDPQIANAGVEPQPERARLARTGDRMQLSVQDDLDRAWRRVGLSLDRIGFTVEDRDRSKGIYYVRYIDPENEGKKPGFFARLFGAKEKIPQEQYQIQLKAVDSSTDVAVLDKEGAPDKSKVGERILSLLHEQLK